MDTTLYDPPQFEPGTVWLVGAGPGDPGLLSLLALHALRSADIIVHDALVTAEVLALAPAATPREYAGKRGGRPSPQQRDISRRLVELAQLGLRVCRLKGGDPLVFGRGGEEALALAEAGIPFRIVPGITAGIGGLAYAGIPLTHRSTNHAVTILTGHDTGGNLPAIDWAAVARGAPVLVFYMALSQLDDIVAHLRAHGRADDEPVAVVAQATTERQKVVISTLAGIAAALAADPVTPPAMVVVGPVVNLHGRLDWRDRLGG